MDQLKNFKNGLIKDNPVFSLFLGICSTLAITTTINNAIGMGVSVIIVLTMSNVIISMIRKITPDEIRIPVYIVIIATLVTIIQMLIQAFAPALNESLGVFIPLIVVNCIILGRAEGFAGKNKVLPSILDGLGMGFGFTIALICMGSIREILGSGTWFGMQVLPKAIDPMLIMILAPGGFFVFGMLMACANWLAARKGKKPATLGCASCPAASGCSKATEGGCE